MARKVVITCAVTGAIHTPSMSPHLPITPAEIARASIEAAEAGASIIHLHARDPETGEPSPDPGLFMQFLPTIKQSCDAVINITTGGGMNMTVEDRLAAGYHLTGGAGLDGLDGSAGYDDCDPQVGGGMVANCELVL